MANILARLFPRRAALIAFGLLLASCGVERDALEGTSADEILPSGDRISAQNVTGEYLADPGDGENWPAAGYSYDNRRFSPLDRLNADNLSDFGLLWSAPLGDGGWNGAQPIEVDERIYLGDPATGVVAYNAVSGERVWRYDPEIAESVRREVSCAGDVASGVAMMRGRLFFGQADGRLTALDASTGAVLWSSPAFENARRAIVGVPIVVGNNVIVGSAAPCDTAREAVEATGSPRGYVSGFVLQDGKLGWRFHTVPTRDQVLAAMGEQGADLLAEAAQSWRYAVAEGREPGGGFVTGNIVYNSKSGDLIFGTGMQISPRGAADIGGRSLFAGSLIALDPETGRYRWHRQVAPDGRRWSANAPMLIAPLPETAAQDEAASDVDAPEKTDEGSTQQPARETASGTSAAFTALDNGWLLAADPAARFLAYASKFTRLFSPIAGYGEDGAIALSEPEDTDIAMPGGSNRSLMSYSPRTGFLYLTSRIPTDARDAENQTSTEALTAFDIAGREAAWTAENAGPAPLVTAGGLVFASYRAPFGRGLAVFDAETGERLYFRGDIVPIGGMATFLAGDRQMVAFPALMQGKARLVVMAAGGRLRTLDSDE